MYMQNRNRLTEYRKQTCGYQRREERGEGQIRGIGLRDTNYLYKIDKQQLYTV